MIYLRSRIGGFLSSASAVGWLLSVAVCCPRAAVAEEEFKLAGIFGHNMVLQQGAEAPVWGWGIPGAGVEVVVQGQKVQTVVDENGKWSAKLRHLKISREPITVTAMSNGRGISYTNVLIGDVWLGSGQSNMEWPTREISRADAEIAAAKLPEIRLFTVPRLMKAQRAHDIKGKWVVCSPETVREFSAVLYLFGRQIHRSTGMPLGLINSSVGGTRIELWTAPEGFAAIPEFADYSKSITETAKRYRETLPEKLAALESWLSEAKAALEKGKPVPITPDWPDHPHPHGGASILYDGMIYPLVPFGLRGFVWYQGEWNGGENEVYVRRMQALIGGWRKAWGAQDLPFYYVQLARMPQKESLPWQGDGLAPTREAQRLSLQIPYTGMAVIIDLEGNADWHPRNKQDVAQRLSLWALKNQYGSNNVVASGPLFREMRVEGQAVRLRFDFADSGLMVGTKHDLDPVQAVPGERLRNFAVAGEDRHWVEATAVIDGADVLVQSPEVHRPVAVRYAYCQDPKGCNLYNKEGLPASPFRTDNW